MTDECPLVAQSGHGLVRRKNNDPKQPVELIKKTLKIYPYQPGGFGTSIGTGLAGKVPLLTSPDGKLDWAFLRPQSPAKFVEANARRRNHRCVL